MLLVELLEELEEAMSKSIRGWHAVPLSAVVVLWVSPFHSSAQTSAPIEVYGPVEAAQVAHSLGTNITPTNEWEYRAAKAAHITWGRFDCSWQNVELQQLPDNYSKGYTLPSACASGLTFSRNYDVHPILDALYGAPYGNVAVATTTSTSLPGSTTIPLRVTSGSLAYAKSGQSYLKMGTGDLSNKHAYAGTLITSTTPTSVTLASALTTTLPAGSSVAINLQLYPPVFLPPGTSFMTHPSIQAYGKYVHYLETQIAKSGIEGRVGIWNEPPWSGDPWDAAGNLYDNPPREQRIKQDFGVELAYYSATLPPVSGAMLDNGYTNKTGNGSLFVPERRALLPSLDAVHKVFASESFHPYGNNPEDGAWLPSCIQTHTSPPLYGRVFNDCTPTGMVVGANIKWQAVINAPVGDFRGLDIGITETGLDRGGSPPATEAQITRFDLRQFLVFSGADVHPILFYRLAGNLRYEWLHADHTPYPVYTAFQRLMKDIDSIARTPAMQYPSCALPVVEDYAGSYPLAFAILVGAQEGAMNNSFLLYTWQRTYSSERWVLLPSPQPTSISIAIPGSLSVTMVKNTVTNLPLLYTVRDHHLTYKVADDPIEVFVSPLPSRVGIPVRCHK